MRYPPAFLVGSLGEIHLSFRWQVPRCALNANDLQSALRSQMSLHWSNVLPSMLPTELPSEYATFPRLSQPLSKTKILKVHDCLVIKTIITGIANRIKKLQLIMYLICVHKSEHHYLHRQPHNHLVH